QDGQAATHLRESHRTQSPLTEIESAADCKEDYLVGLGRVSRADHCTTPVKPIRRVACPSRVVAAGGPRRRGAGAGLAATVRRGRRPASASTRNAAPLAPGAAASAERPGQRRSGCPRMAEAPAPGGGTTGVRLSRPPPLPA